MRKFSVQPGKNIIVKSLRKGIELLESDSIFSRNITSQNYQNMKTLNSFIANNSLKDLNKI